MTLEEAMHTACAQVGIVPPNRIKVGDFVRTNTLERNGKGDATVLIFDDRQGGIATNWQTGQQHRFTLREPGQAPIPRPRDVEDERRAERDRLEVERICLTIVRGCRQDTHPYLARKGFPLDHALVCDDPRVHLPNTRLGEAIASAVPASDKPLLVVPGRLGAGKDGRITTIQFITADGEKKNLLRGQMGGTSYRICSGGPENWVCEGFATALSVRDALRLLGRRATVWSAFAASNVAKVAQGVPGARIAADHDKPVPTLGGLGAGEYFAVQSGRAWTMPPNEEDFNDMHQRLGLRAVALHLKDL